MLRAMADEGTRPRGENPPPERKAVPPFHSPLWQHWELIRSMRRARKTWKQVAEALEQVHGLKTSHKTIHNFVKRALRIRKEGRLPFGWEDPEPEPSQPAPAPAKPAAGAKPAPPATPDLAQQNAAIEALRAKAKQLPPEEPEWNIPIDPDKPL
jgi:hypothetical protein